MTRSPHLLLAGWPLLASLLVGLSLLIAGSDAARAESAASQARALQSGHLAAGGAHTCAVLDTGQVRCWGSGANGRLGYGNTVSIGDNETPASVGPVDLGSGRTATALGAGSVHTCAVLDTGQVRCWGFGGSGRLGYGTTDTIGDDETPASAGAVDLGSGRTAAAISTGSSHACAMLDTGQVRCWGLGSRPAGPSRHRHHRRR